MNEELTKEQIEYLAVKLDQAQDLFKNLDDLIQDICNHLDLAVHRDRKQIYEAIVEHWTASQLLSQFGISQQS